MASASATTYQVTSPECSILRLLVVEDHPVYLEGLSAILEQFDEQAELLCVSTVQEAQEVLRSQQDFELILLDLGLPDEGGLSLLKFLGSHKVFIPVVILSASDSIRDVQNSMQCGASGFISKASNRREIHLALKTVLSGETYLPEFFRANDSFNAAGALPELTPRQKDVLHLVCEGLPNKRICQRLNLTEHTVKSHLKSLFSALDVHNRTECARVAQEWHLLG